MSYKNYSWVQIEGAHYFQPKNRIGERNWPALGAAKHAGFARKAVIDEIIKLCVKGLFTDGNLPYDALDMLVGEDIVTFANGFLDAAVAHFDSIVHGKATTMEKYLVVKALTFKIAKHCPALYRRLRAMARERREGKPK